MFWNDYHYILRNNTLELLHQCLWALSIFVLFVSLMESANEQKLVYIIFLFPLSVSAAAATDVFGTDIVS